MKQTLQFHFDPIIGTDQTQVTLDLTLDMALLGERLTEIYPVQLQQGTKTHVRDRVEYRFRLTNEQAELLEHAIFQAAEDLQMTLE